MTKRRNQRRGGSPWKTRIGVIFILLLFVFSAAVSFPDQTLGKITDHSIPDFRLGLDLQGGTHLVYEADMSLIDDDAKESALEGVRDVIERRVNAFGVSEPLVQTTTADGHYRVIVELAGVLDVSDAIKQIGETPILEFKEPDTDSEKEVTLSDTEGRLIDEKQAEQLAYTKEILDRAIAGEDFGELVQEFTIAEPEKEHNGEIGWQTLESYNFIISKVEEKGYGKGIVPEVIPSKQGYEVVNIQDIRDGAKMDLSHILICYKDKTGCTSDRTREEARALVNDLLQQVNAENFADLAKANSDDASAVDGGSLGTITQGQLVTEFEEAAMLLPVGGISTTAVETDFGYHIIYKTAEEKVKQYKIQRLVTEKEGISIGANDIKWKNTGLSGKHLESSQVVFDQNTNVPIVTLEFNKEGADLFEELTGRLVGNRIAIFLDGSIISSPVVQQKISGGSATIQGNFTIEEAKLLAQRLNAGALPVPINLLSQQTVGPSLGQSSLQKSLNAAMIGFLLVAIFMVLYYRLPGLIAIISLVVYTLLNLAIYKGLDVTITLSGVAGFILSIGMAVDANVLIFERMREELKSGRDLPTSIEEGFRRAWTSIRDGNLTTLIASAVLFWFSTSFIKGFALTLSIGILLSMFSAIWVTRILLRAIAGSKKHGGFWFGGKNKSKSNAQ